MKKSTLIVVIVAVALGAFVYFYDSKHTPKATSEDTSKPAFSIKADDISALTIHNAGQTISLSKQGTDWDLTQPVQTRGDQTTIDGLASDLSGLQIQRSFVPTDSLSKYGLASSAVKIRFRDKKGASHSIDLGDKDFSNSSVYALVDGSKQVDLLSTALLDDATKPVSQLRDRSMIGLNGAEVTGITLNESSGRFAVTKTKAGWEITNPRQTLADSSTVDALVSSLSSSKFTDVVTETSTDLAKYGLTHPTVTLDVTAQGGKQFHLLLAKKGDSYYGRDQSRPMIFSLDKTAYDSLDKTFFDLRDKSILQFDPAAIQTVTIQNENGTIECSQGKDDQWSVVQPVADKGKSVQSWKILDPLQNTRATKIYDTPSASVLAHLKKPLIQIALTDKSRKTTTVQFFYASTDSVYVRTSAAPEVYEVSTQVLKDLGFKISDLLI